MEVVAELGVEVPAQVLVYRDTDPPCIRLQHLPGWLAAIEVVGGRQCKREGVYTELLLPTWRVPLATSTITTAATNATNVPISMPISMPTSMLLLMGHWTRMPLQCGPWTPTEACMHAPPEECRVQTRPLSSCTVCCHLYI
jgi:hypothetical protein